MAGNLWDCIIVGGGPAGLTAAVYLARYRRNVVVFDNQNSRAMSIPLSHNYPGFPEGISGKVLLEKLHSRFICRRRHCLWIKSNLRCNKPGCRCCHFGS
ncbi:NAD(P)/FAD-dependent oxidoreductase [Legionella fairfieldensis]|uniref:NAD(P)/FAD-dependent oxidoreductase n=1 Tax=Legionella fairfieldensis TaxID=45064 RepID=UPI00055F6CE8|nr:NAD(P)/FAD-dependent oxidoreductase [Legionella fairfieldensis]